MKLVSLISAAVLMLAMALYAPAQINSGVITGIVADPQGARVPSAKVEVVEDETGFSYTATTNGSGEFTVPYLKAGKYTVSVTAKGFPLYRLSGVTLTPGATVRTDVALQLSKLS